MGLFLMLLQALALITTPVDGDYVFGAVNITGAAASPQFDHYELAFAYDPNPTDNWFEITPPSNTPVTNGLLGVWDTSNITDGSYMLRLRVYNSGSKTPVDVIVRNITIRNQAPTPTRPAPATTELPASPAASAQPATPTLQPTTATIGPAAGPTATPAPALAATALALPAFLDLSSYSAAFCNGVYLTATLFLGLGVYILLRDKIRRPIRKWLRRIVSDIRKP